MVELLLLLLLLLFSVHMILFLLFFIFHLRSYWALSLNCMRRWMCGACNTLNITATLTHTHTRCECVHVYVIHFAFFRRLSFLCACPSIYLFNTESCSCIPILSTVCSRVYWSFIMRTPSISTNISHSRRLQWRSLFIIRFFPSILLLALLLFLFLGSLVLHLFS